MVGPLVDLLGHRPPSRGPVDREDRPALPVLIAEMDEQRPAVVLDTKPAGGVALRHASMISGSGFPAAIRVGAYARRSWRRERIIWRPITSAIDVVIQMITVANR